MQTRTGRTSTRTLATRTRACTTPSRKRRDSLWKRSWSHGLCIRMRRGHQPSAHSHPSGSSRRDATSWRGGTTDALWFQTMVTTLASSSWTHIAEISPWSIWMGGLYMARPARRRTRNIKPWLLCFKASASGSAKSGVQFSASVLRPRLQRQV